MKSGKPEPIDPAEVFNAGVRRPRASSATRSKFLGYTAYIAGALSLSAASKGSLLVQAAADKAQLDQRPFPFHELVLGHGLLPFAIATAVAARVSYRTARASGAFAERARAENAAKNTSPDITR